MIALINDYMTARQAAENRKWRYICWRKSWGCLAACRIDKDTVFFAFLYDFSKEYVVHFRRLFDGVRSDNEYKNLISVRPQYKDNIARMILLDFITKQDDRHLSNIAVQINGQFRLCGHLLGLCSGDSGKTRRIEWAYQP